jgi:phospholipase/carboxylesterase
MPGIENIMHLGAAADKAAVTCIVVHGRNQSPEEMQTNIVSRLSKNAAAFVLPRANDKCWYNALAVVALTDSTRTELGRSQTELSAIIADVRRTSPDTKIVLAGFSQGACLSLEHGFTGENAPDTLVAFTGCRVGIPSDERAANIPSHLPVYLSAGSADPWIPLHAFCEAAGELGKAGTKLRADIFPDRPHEVSTAEIAILNSVIADLTAGLSPRFGAAR